MAPQIRIQKTHQKLRDEFCAAYNFSPEQIGFDGDSIVPIFDFDALSVLSTKLCNLPHVDVDFGSIEPLIQMATSRAYALLPNGNTRKIFGSAVVGEVMHNGTRIESIHQAVKVSRARALRIILRAVGFDPVAAHYSFRQNGHVIELQLPAKLTRDNERAEIHLLAQGLGLIIGHGANEVRNEYETLMGRLFHGKRTSTKLTDIEHTQFLTALRALSKAKAVANDHSRSNAA